MIAYKYHVKSRIKAVLTLVVIAPECDVLVGVERPLFESLPLYVVVSTTTSGCTTMDCMEDWADWPELCQLGSSVMVVSEGAHERGADLFRELLSPAELDLRVCTGEHFGDGVDSRSGCSSGRTCGWYRN